MIEIFPPFFLWLYFRKLSQEFSEISFLLSSSLALSLGLCTLLCTQNLQTLSLPHLNFTIPPPSFSLFLTLSMFLSLFLLSAIDLLYLLYCRCPPLSLSLSFSLSVCLSHSLYVCLCFFFPQLTYYISYIVDVLHSLSLFLLCTSSSLFHSLFLLFIFFLYYISYFNPLLCSFFYIYFLFFSVLSLSLLGRGLYLFNSKARIMFPFDCYVYKVLSPLFMTLIIFTKRPLAAAALPRFLLSLSAEK